MRWVSLLLLLLCLGCGRPVLIAAPPNAPLPARPMVDFEPGGDWPDFRKVKGLFLEPYWL